VPVRRTRLRPLGLGCRDKSAITSANAKPRPADTLVDLCSGSGPRDRNAARGIEHRLPRSRRELLSELRMPIEDSTELCAATNASSAKHQHGQRARRPLGDELMNIRTSAEVRLTRQGQVVESASRSGRFPVSDGAHLYGGYDDDESI